MSLGSSRARLTGLTRELMAHWQETKETWDDAKSAEFEARFLTPLTAAVDRASEALEHLDELVNKVRKDCE
ncbi:MAG: hypothetical protein KF833_23610 [Verrucomicrobiae bacterium]|nr:hypothetical protein [Verrucomicrobiae bacterium]